jgi:hypothetical protein
MSGQYDPASVVYHATPEQWTIQELTLSLPARTIPVICGYKINLRCPCARHEVMTGCGVVRLSTRPLYSKVNGPHYPLPRRLGRPERRSGQFGDSKNPLPLLGIKPQFLSRPGRSQCPYSASAILTPLWRTLHSLNHASWYTHVRKTNKMHTFLNNSYHLDYPRHVSNK